MNRGFSSKKVSHKRRKEILHVRQWWRWMRNQRWRLAFKRSFNDVRQRFGHSFERRSLLYSRNGGQWSTKSSLRRSRSIRWSSIVHRRAKRSIWSPLTASHLPWFPIISDSPSRRTKSLKSSSARDQHSSQITDDQTHFSDLHDKQVPRARWWTEITLERGTSFISSRGYRNREKTTIKKLHARQFGLIIFPKGNGLDYWWISSLFNRK